MNADGEEGDAAPALRVSEIADPRRLEALAADWADLWSRCPTASPFQSPAWLIPWWRHLGSGRLASLAVWQGERLVGMAPLCVRTGLSGRLVFLGTGQSDTLDFLIEPGCMDEGILPATLRDRLPPWGCADLHALPPGAHALAWKSWGSVMAQDVCPVRMLPDSVQSLQESLPRGLRSYLASVRRRVARTRDAAIEAATAETLAEHLEALFRLHAARWRTRGLPGVFFRPAVRAFHRDATARLHEAGLLRLYGLRLDGTLRASLYALAGPGRTCYYAGGFDPALASLSPGSLLILGAMEAAIGEGHREFDFLRGGEPYRYRWGAVDRPRMRLVAPGAWGAAAPLLAEAEERAKGLALKGVRAWAAAVRGGGGAPRPRRA